MNEAGGQAAGQSGRPSAPNTTIVELRVFVAERNSQLMLYGLGALLEFDLLYDIRNVRMTIVQPRLSNISIDETAADALIRRAQTEVRPKALLAHEGKGEFCRGRGHQGRDRGRLHRHLQDDASGRGRSGKAHLPFQSYAGTS